MENHQQPENDQLSVAVIGMSCRFPGAKNLQEFWNNLTHGVESVRELSPEELQESGVSEELLNNPNYIRVAPVLDDVEFFDAGFFGFSPGEAKILDPQRRLFLECGWEAFENAGYDPYQYNGVVGVYGAAGINQYYNNNLNGNSEIFRVAGEQQLLISNDKDHLPTHLSYKLNLHGPSVNVNTACSSSLVAIHLARLSLLTGESDMVVAGGSAIMVPNKAGYLYVDDSILSQDGHCRAFDAKGTGTLWGSGCGVVILKRLQDAIDDNDNIRAIIRGSAINNDGNQKVGFTAPSVEGQSDVIIQAIASAGMEPEDLSYIETHGTGTKLGDPIEIAALNEVFEEYEQTSANCLIGSVKPNIGHLGAAAGVASFIKTVLALEHKMIPPSINFSTPNPNIDFANSPFSVNQTLTPWQPENKIAAAGISSLAVGGTNCHVVLQQAPARQAKATHSLSAPTLLLFSARTRQGLKQSVVNLLSYLNTSPAISLQDMAFTLQCGRHRFEGDNRLALWAEDLERAKEQMQTFVDAGPGDYVLAEDFDFADFPEQFSNGDSESLRKWFKDEDFSWQEMRASLPGQSIELPTYPFERQKYWVSPPKGQLELTQEFKLNNKTGGPDDWYYEQSWQRRSLVLKNKVREIQGKQWLVFTNANSLTSRLISELRLSGENVITVEQGERFERVNKTHFTLDPTQFEQYDELVQALAENSELPDQILHCWSVDGRSKSSSKVSIDSFRRYQFVGYYSVLNLVQALNRVNFNSELSIKILTNNLHDITGEEKTYPEKSSVIGLVKVLQQEFQNMTCQSIDFDVPKRGSDDEERLLESLKYEVLFYSGNIITAYRNNHRWVQRYERVDINAESAEDYPIKEGGRYLVYDGLVGIGLEIAKHLLVEYKAEVLVLGDVSFPKESEWDKWLQEHDEKEDIAVKIRGMHELQALGGIFLSPMPLDNNIQELESIIKTVESGYGDINGVLHCSGGTANGHVRSVNNASYELTERDFITIPYALIALDEVFKHRQLDFRLVMSSLGSILGGILFVSYGSSNCLVSAYSEYRNKREPTRWAVQCWDSWDIEWKINDYKNTTLHGNITERLRNIALTVDEGLECFRRSLAFNSRSHITISSTDLQARIDKWVNKNTMETFKVDVDSQSERHPRPSIDVEYIEPEGQLEQHITDSFQRLLDIDKVGRLDNFFELGGHSLLATQLISELRVNLNVDLAISDILEFPTAETLAKSINSHQQSEVEVS